MIVQGDDSDSVINYISFSMPWAGIEAAQRIFLPAAYAQQHPHGCDRQADWLRLVARCLS